MVNAGVMRSSLSHATGDEIGTCRATRYLLKPCTGRSVGLHRHVGFYVLYIVLQCVVLPIQVHQQQKILYVPVRWTVETPGRAEKVAVGSFG